MTTSDPGRGPAGEEDTEPVCPRHPDRVAYVRCQRCERPACPECQRPAAVGIQCVDCVREAARSTPRARTAVGGRWSGAGARPVATLVLAIACITVYLLQMQTGDELVRRFAYVPYLTAYEPYRMITSAFLHGSVLHLVFNMYALWLLGGMLERELGVLRYLALYVLSGFGGSVAVLLLARPSGDSWVTAVVGASGAVFGIMAGLFVVSRRLGRDTGPIVGLVVANAVIGFLPGTNIAWQAHLGGLLTGAACAAVLVLAPRERRALFQVVGLLTIAVVLVAAVLIRVAAGPATAFPT